MADMTIKNCLQCNKAFRTFPCRLKNGEGKYCSKSCGGEGTQKILMSKPTYQAFWEGKKFIKEHRRKIGEAHTGEKHYLWIKDRSQLKTDERKKGYDSRYKCWMREVKNRDNWKCKILNKDCKGRLEAHHILNWQDFPELRYEINNGITLCVAHHPRSRAKENELSPYFKELVAVSKELNWLK